MADISQLAEFICVFYFGYTTHKVHGPARMFWIKLKQHLAEILLLRAQYLFLSKSLTPIAQAMEQIKGISFLMACQGSFAWLDTTGL